MARHQDTHRLLAALHSFERGKVVTAREAVALIRDGDTLATGGFVGIGFAENIAVALEERFLEAAKEAPDGIGARAGSRSSMRRDRATARNAVSIISGTTGSSSA